MREYGIVIRLGMCNVKNISSTNGYSLSKNMENTYAYLYFFVEFRIFIGHYINIGQHIFLMRNAKIQFNLFLI